MSTSFHQRPLSTAGVALATFFVVVLISCGELGFWKLWGKSVDSSPVVVATFALAATAAVAAALLSLAVSSRIAMVLALCLAVLPFVRNWVVLFDGRFLAFLEPLPISWPMAVVLSVTISFAGSEIARRRRGVLSLGVVATICLGATLLAHGVPEARPRPVARADLPDIVLIVMDTTRRDRLSVYGHPKPTTPQLESFAEQAQVYENAWSVALWTPPSHASMFTGLLPAQHGVDGQSRPPFPATVATLPEVLQQAGYRTAGFPANPQLLHRSWARGFDAYRPPWYRGRHTLVRQLNRMRLGTVNDWLMGSTAGVFKLAREWWLAQPGSPRFLFINVLDPHKPYRPPPDLFRDFLPGITEADAYAIGQDQFPYHLNPGVPDRARDILGRLYDAEIAAMDREIGGFMTWLGQHGELDNSLILITADHGERLGERGLLGHDLVMDQYLLRVPLLIRYPPALTPSRIARRVQLDGLPGYILHLVGLEAPPAMAEASLHERDRSIALAQYQHPDWFLTQLVKRHPDIDVSAFSGNWHLATDGRFAYVASRGGNSDSGVLTDMATDPNWQSDVSSQWPAILSKLRAAVDQLPPFKDVEEQDLDADTIKRLRALGYLQ